MYIFLNFVRHYVWQKITNKRGTDGTNKASWPHWRVKHWQNINLVLILLLITNMKSREEKWEEGGAVRHVCAEAKTTESVVLEYM